jgi:hypothetical protein
MNTTIDPQSVENQRICKRLVDREVHYCVSMLVDHFAKNPDALTGSNYSYDDILNLCSGQEWEDAATDAGWEQFTDEYGAVCYRDTNDGQTWACESWQELCEEFGIEPHDMEIYEHWIVSKWFAEKLAEKGHPTGELFDLTIWGRPTTGQAIYMDHVIGEIAKDMEILKGQKNEWTAD